MVAKKFDVAILGVWYGLNYGSLLTYYALRKQIQEAGKSVVMVKYLPNRQPETIRDEQREDGHNNRFVRQQGYETFTVDAVNVNLVNDLADTFVVGSDQVWNYHIARLYDDFFYMRYIDADKRKIANAVSFGHAVDFAPEEARPAIANLMKRFNAISVREDSAVDLLREKYDVPAEWHADPLLTIDAEQIRDLGRRSHIDLKDDRYLLAYILDPSDEKVRGIERLAEKLGLGVRLIVDGFSRDRANSLRAFGALSSCVQEHVGLDEFVALFANSAYVVTDSFHGAVMSIKMEKDFAVVTTKDMHRGLARLNSLLRLTGLFGRHTFDARALFVKQRFVTPIDYSVVNKLVDRTAKLSRLWLTTALEIPVEITVGMSPVTLADDELFGIMQGKSWSFGIAGRDPYTTDVRFLPNGTIDGILSENEAFWKVSNSKVLISNTQGRLSHVFMLKSLNHGVPILQGDCSADHSVIHILR